MFAAQVDDHEAAVPLLYVVNRECCDLYPAQPAAHEQSQHRAIALSFESLRVRRIDECLGLFAGEPVPGPGALLL